MLKAKADFNANIESAASLSAVFSYLKAEIKTVMSFDDLLRAQLVYSVSALDKLIHDIVRVGMLEIFLNRRPSTAKFETETIPYTLHIAMNAATIPPKEYLFEQYIIGKFRTVSFQKPESISDGLSLVWNEAHKWKKIASKMSENERDVRTKLTLIVTRRNSIVHEFDIDPITGTQAKIIESEIIDISQFLKRCGNAIVDSVL